MRTTLTLADDVATELERLQKQRHGSFKDAVNEALRAGLAELLRKPSKGRRRYATKAVSLGSPRLPNLDNIAEVLAVSEGDGRA